MVVGACPRTRALVRVKHLLDPLKQLGGDQRLMPARILDTLVLDVAQVVAISQYLAQLSQRDWPCWTPGRCRHPQARLGQHGAQALNRVLTGCEGFKGHDHERCSLGVRLDGPHLVSQGG